MHIIANKINNYTSSFKDISVIRLANTNTTQNFKYSNTSLTRAHGRKKAVATAFLKSHISQVNEAATEMFMCGSHPQSLRSPDGKVKGYCNRRCHNKLCSYCAQIEATVRSIQWTQAMNAYVKQKGKSYVYFLTLTVRNCEVQNIGQVLTNMNKALKKFQDRIFFRREIGAWMKGTEITNSKLKIIDTHPHFHIVLFSDRPLEEAYLEYIDEGKEDCPTSLNQYLFREWEDCLGATEIVGESAQRLDIVPAIRMRLDAEVLSCLAIGRLKPDEAGAGTGVTDDLANAILRSDKLNNDEEMLDALNKGKPFDERKLLELKIKEQANLEKENEVERTIKYIVKYITEADDLTQNPEWAANLMVGISRRRFHSISQNLKKLIPVHEKPQLTKEAVLLSGRTLRLKRHEKDKFYDCIVTQNNAVFTLDCEETKEQKLTGQSLHQAIKNGCIRMMFEQGDLDPEKWLTIIDYAFASLHGLPEAGYMSRHILQEWMDNAIYRETDMGDELWNMVENMVEFMKQTGLKPWDIIGTPHPDIALPLDEDQQYGLTLIRQGYDAIQKRYTEVQRTGYFDGTRTQQEVLDDTVNLDNQISNITYELLHDELGETNYSSDKIEELKRERTSLSHKRSANVQKLKGLARPNSKERFEAVADLHQFKFTVIEPMTDAMVSRIELKMEEITADIADLITLNNKRGGHISNDDKAILNAGRAKIKKLRKYLREHPNFRPVADTCDYSLEMLPPREEPILQSLSHEVAYPFLPHGQGKHDWSACFGDTYTEQATDKADAEAELMAYKAMCKAQKWNTLGYGTNKKLMAKDDINPRGGLVPTTCYPTTAELRFSGVKDSATMEEVTMALFDEQAVKAKVSGKRMASWDAKQAKRIAKGFSPEEAPAGLTLRDPADMNFAVFDWTVEQALIKNASKALEKQEYTATVMRVDTPDAHTGWSHETATGDSFTTWRRNRGKRFNSTWFAEHAVQVSILIEIDGRTVATKFFAPSTMKAQWQALMGRAITKAHRMTLQQCLDRPPIGQRLEPN